MPETAEHIFCECVWTRRLWGSDDVLQGGCVQNLLESTLGGSSREGAVKLAAIFSTVWNVRNEIVWKQASWSIEGLRGQIERLQVSWKAAFTVVRNQVEGQIRASCWAPPSCNTLKCNVDVAVFDDGAGFGAVVRDHEGRFVAARSGRLACNQHPFMAEVLAAKEALIWLAGLQGSRFILESDCLEFCNAFNSSMVDYSYVGTIIKQCLAIARDIGDVQVQHVKRTANRVAHALARATGSSSVSKSWTVIPPTCIFELLGSE
ncbi:PREDICTED: uncharacterized protein LOC109173080 [Ipomoea nil]|uniref:uncharacterized protein LOC109173080 n=1 Tax=Ipomoea nil TaxID=35883 RepID=UPI0009019B77|nr:PREDICTED: uncharacterized protein LOC109173080 [Ipomoea nil]